MTFLHIMYRQLLGLLSSMKGMTSESVASGCVLKLYQGGEIGLVNKSEPLQFSQYAAHFTTDSDQPQACNFANFAPFGEDGPLRVTLVTSLIHRLKLSTLNLTLI